jgi:hypothetical protein
MSKMAAIDYAVRQQVLDDEKGVVTNYKELIGPDPGAVPLGRSLDIVNRNSQFFYTRCPIV